MHGNKMQSWASNYNPCQSARAADNERKGDFLIEKRVMPDSCLSMLAVQIKAVRGSSSNYVLVGMPC